MQHGFPASASHDLKWSPGSVDRRGKHYLVSLSHGVTACHLFRAFSTFLNLFFFTCAEHLQQYPAIPIWITHAIEQGAPSDLAALFTGFAPNSHLEGINASRFQEWCKRQWCCICERQPPFRNWAIRARISARLSSPRVTSTNSSALEFRWFEVSLALVTTGQALLASNGKHDSSHFGSRLTKLAQLERHLLGKDQKSLAKGPCWTLARSNHRELDLKIWKDISIN